MIRFLVLTLALGSACVKREPLPPITGPVPSDKPLALKLPKYPGNELYDITQDRGNVVLLDVWATWCEPCRDSLPIYQDLAKEYAPRGLRVYTINIDEDVSMIPAFLAEARITLPVLLDANAGFSERELKVSQMPTSFLIDRRGMIRYVHQGVADGFLPKYQAEIEELLAESVK